MREKKNPIFPKSIELSQPLFAVVAVADAAAAVGATTGAVMAKYR